MKQIVVSIIFLIQTTSLLPSDNIKVPQHLWQYAPLIQTLVNFEKKQNKMSQEIERPFPLQEKNKLWSNQAQELALHLLKAYHTLQEQCNDSIENNTIAQLPLIDIAKNALYEILTETIQLVNFVNAPKGIRLALVHALCAQFANHQEWLNSPEPLDFLSNNQELFKDFTVPFFYTPRKIIYNEITKIVSGLKKTDKECFLTGEKQHTLFGHSLLKISPNGQFLALYQRDKGFSLKDLTTSSWHYQNLLPQQAEPQAIWINNMGLLIFREAKSKRFVFLDQQGNEILIPPQKEWHNKWLSLINDNFGIFNTYLTQNELSLIKNCSSSSKHLCIGHIFHPFPDPENKHLTLIPTVKLLIPADIFGNISFLNQNLANNTTLLICNSTFHQEGKEESRLVSYLIPPLKEPPSNPIKLLPTNRGTISVNDYDTANPFLLTSIPNDSSTENPLLTISTTKTFSPIKTIHLPVQKDISFDGINDKQGRLFFLDKTTNKGNLMDLLSGASYSFTPTTTLPENWIDFGGDSTVVNINKKFSIIYSQLACEKLLPANIALKTLLFAHKQEQPLTLSTEGWGYQALKNAIFAHYLSFKQKGKTVEISLNENDNELTTLEKYIPFFNSIKALIKEDFEGKLSVYQLIEKENELLKAGIEKKLFNEKEITFHEAMQNFITKEQTTYPFSLFLKKFSPQERAWLTTNPLKKLVDTFEKLLKDTTNNDLSSLYSAFRNALGPCLLEVKEELPTGEFIIELPKAKLCTDTLFSTTAYKPLRDRALYLIFKTYPLIFLQGSLEALTKDTEESLLLDAQESPGTKPTHFDALIKKERPESLQATQNTPSAYIEKTPDYIKTIKEALVYTAQARKDFLYEAQVIECIKLLPLESQKELEELLTNSCSIGRLEKLQERMELAHDTCVATIMQKTFSELALKLPPLILPLNGSMPLDEEVKKLEEAYGFPCFKSSDVTPQQRIVTAFGKLTAWVEKVDLFDENVRKTISQSLKNTIQEPFDVLTNIIKTNDLNDYFSRIIFFNKLSFFIQNNMTIEDKQKYTYVYPYTLNTEQLSTQAIKLVTQKALEQPLTYFTKTSTAEEKKSLFYKTFLLPYFGAQKEDSSHLPRLLTSPLATNDFFKDPTWKKQRNQLLFLTLSRFMSIYFNKKIDKIITETEEIITLKKAGGLKDLRTRLEITRPPSPNPIIHCGLLHDLEKETRSINALKKFIKDYPAPLKSEQVDTVLTSLEPEQQQLINKEIQEVQLKALTHKKIDAAFETYIVNKIQEMLKTIINEMTPLNSHSEHLKKFGKTFGFTLINSKKSCTTTEVIDNVHKFLEKKMYKMLSTENQKKLKEFVEQEFIKNLK